MPVNTMRAWVIGIIWSILLPGMNQFFFFRYPSVTVTGVSPTAPFPEMPYLLPPLSRRSRSLRSCCHTLLDGYGHMRSQT